MEDLVNECDHHPNVIIHIDIDCFYAQVEMIRNPSLKGKPVGVQQKNFMVTCNYEARSLGVSKTMRISEAVKAFPELILIDGSDLTHYRHFSAEIFTLLRKYSKNIEKLGLDENFIDITEKLDDYACNSPKIEGSIFNFQDFDMSLIDCHCGCHGRLIKGSYIAKLIRDDIYNSLGITTCAGIAHNKLLAKLVSGHKKPYDQTVVFPSQTFSVISSLKSLKSIPGIGWNTLKTLQSLNINTVEELQECSLSILNKKFDSKFSKQMKNLCNGIDDSKVKSSGPCLTISVEDAFRKVSSISDVKEKLRILVDRVLILLQEDGRFPNRFRLTVRKADSDRKYGNRITKDVELPSSLFGNSEKLAVSAITVNTLNEFAFDIFKKLIETSKDFHLTLLGVGFNKFYERSSEADSISKYFTKKHTAVDSSFPDSTKNLKTCENSNNEFKQNLEFQGLVESQQHCQETFDQEVFDSLPEDIKKELKEASTSAPSGKRDNSFLDDNLSQHRKSTQILGKKIKADRQQKIDSYFRKCDSDLSRLDHIGNKSGNGAMLSSTSQNKNEETEIGCNFIIRNDIKRKLRVKGIDFDVFNELPQEIKEELLGNI